MKHHLSSVYQKFLLQRMNSCSASFLTSSPEVVYAWSLQQIFLADVFFVIVKLVIRVGMWYAAICSLSR